MKKVAVLGASHAGQALACALAVQGIDVHIYDHQDFKENIEGINQRGGTIELTDQMSGFGKISLATTNMRAALENVDVIMLIVPSFAQEIFLRLAAPYLQDNQVMLILPGNLGSVIARKIILEAGNHKNIKIAETNSVPLASRLNKPGSVSIYGKKKFIDIAALPSEETEDVIRTLSDCFPINLHPMKNVLSVSFTNFNMLVHCTTSVMNTGWIETTKGNFDFYRDGISPSVCRVLETIDQERAEICSRLNLDPELFISWWRRAYPPEKDYQTLYEIIHNSKVHTGRGPSAPKNMQLRYITEDVPYCLVPLASFGRLLNSSAKTAESIIGLASILNETDYWETGRNPEKLGFSNMKPNEILDYVNFGSR